MLVLSRHRDETIVVTTPSGEVVNVTVVDIRGDKVRLGFQAAPDVTIDRQEVWAAKAREARLAEANLAGPHQGPRVTPAAS